MCVNFPWGIFDSTQQPILVHSFQGLRSWSLDLCTWRSTVVERWCAKENCLIRLVITVAHRDHSLVKLLMPFFFLQAGQKGTRIPKYTILAVYLLQMGSPKVSRTSKLVLLMVGDRKANGRHLSLQGKFQYLNHYRVCQQSKPQLINMSLRHSNSPSIKVMRSTE